MENAGINTPRPLAVALAERITLYFSRNVTAIFLRGHNLLIQNNLGKEQEIPLNQIRRVVLVGKARVDPLILYRLMRSGIPIDWLDVFGRPLGQLLSLEDTRPRGHIDQISFRNSAEALELARQTLLAKLDNCREVIRRRIHQKLPWAERRKALMDARDADSLRGAEGMAARMYFSCWKDLLHEFQWLGRHPHPAPDPVNMLLSLGYGFLHNRLSSALVYAALDPRLGFFHMSRGRHCALASDLMEPLRALVDAAVLNLIRRNEIAPASFRIRGERCVCADRTLFVRLLEAFEDMFIREHVFYPSARDPHAGHRCSLNDAMDNLAESYASHILQASEFFMPRLAPCPAT